MDDQVFGPDALLKEVQTLLGLENIFFALVPNWVQPAERLQGLYSSISLAFSDPDGPTTAKLLNGKHGLFGKEVHIEKWLDKPPLVQCSRCHKLGHNTTSQRCKVPKGDIRCARCGGAHHKDAHACLCRGSHTVAGECKCIFPCLNCSSREHDCQSFNCLDRDNYRM